MNHTESYFFKEKMYNKEVCIIHKTCDAFMYLKLYDRAKKCKQGLFRTILTVNANSSCRLYVGFIRSLCHCCFWLFLPFAIFTNYIHSASLYIILTTFNEADNLLDRHRSSINVIRECSNRHARSAILAPAFDMYIFNHER